MKIGISGTIGYSKAAELLEENRDFLERRFPGFFIEQFIIAKSQPNNYSMKNIKEIGEGGIFRALWELCEEAECGCEVRIRDIPMMQEVIEIMECFDENPYEAVSGGAFLTMADELPEGFVLIGETNSSKDRVVVDGESRRFLTPPSRQDKDILDRKRK
ncbi:MAG: hypothetical protein IKH67_01600 [Lachnospiraceae bacterium]|nr:hypothetical protein [Lachnospiraceae bacterium]